MLNFFIKNEEQYQALRDKGYSKEKVVCIVNVSNMGEKGGQVFFYEEWMKEEFY